MFLVTANKAKQLLYTSYIQRVTPDEIRRGVADVKILLAELSPGFRLLADFTQVDAIDLESAPEIGLLMEAVDQHGVGMVMRVIPNPDMDDIGMNILTVFHYPHRPHIATCRSMVEAMQALSL